VRQVLQRLREAGKRFARLGPARRVRRKVGGRVILLGTGNDGEGIDVDVPEEGLALQAVEDALIDRTLAMCEGNVSRAARMLGVSRDQLRYRLAKRGA